MKTFFLSMACSMAFVIPTFAFAEKACSLESVVAKEVEKLEHELTDEQLLGKELNSLKPEAARNLRSLTESPLKGENKDLAALFDESNLNKHYIVTLKDGRQVNGVLGGADAEGNPVLMRAMISKDGKAIAETEHGISIKPGQTEVARLEQTIRVKGSAGNPDYNEMVAIKSEPVQLSDPWKESQKLVGKNIELGSKLKRETAGNELDWTRGRVTRATPDEIEFTRYYPEHGRDLTGTIARSRRQIREIREVKDPETEWNLVKRSFTGHTMSLDSKADWMGKYLPPLTRINVKLDRSRDTTSYIFMKAVKNAAGGPQVIVQDPKTGEYLAILIRRIDDFYFGHLERITDTLFSGVAP